MNDEDLKQCYRMFAMLGYLMNGDYHPHEIPALSKAMADAMMEEPKDDGGITTVVKRTRKTK